MKKILFVVILLISISNVSWWAKVWFSTNKNYLTENCPVKIDVMLDTQWQMTTAMDLRIFLDPSNFSFNDFDGNWWLFKVYTLPVMSTIVDWRFAGKNVAYSLLSTMSRWWVLGSGKIWTLTITPVTWAQNVKLDFYMIPNNDIEDTSVIVVSWSSAIDVLSVANWLNLPVKQGMCDEDIVNMLQLRQNALFAEIQNKQNAKVIVMQNQSFKSQFAFREIVDNFFSWVVINIMNIILFSLFVAVIISILIMLKIYKKISFDKISIKS